MIVIPMAGESRRFTQAGYTVPKFMLALEGKSLFAHSVSSFAHYFATEPFLFIARDAFAAQDFIAAQVRELGIARWSTFMLSGPTGGQADTVLLGLDGHGVPDGEPITIFNIDTFRPAFRYPAKAWFGSAAGYLEVMHSRDPGFSFARPGSTGADRVAETAEKRVISDLASTGLYWFAAAHLFREAMDVGDSREHGELYVAPLYNRLIARDLDIRYETVAQEDVIFCGTPGQYHALLEGAGERAPGSPVDRAEPAA